MRSLPLLLAFSFALCASAQVAEGSLQFPKVNAKGTLTAEYMPPPVPSSVFGLDSAGSLKAFALGEGIGIVGGALVIDGGAGGDWEDITGTPTTLAGYGITDAITATAANAAFAATSHTHAFSAITSKPTTLAGYGITDAITEAAANAAFAATSHTHAFSAITSKPTTLAGYGITDAITEAAANAAFQPASAGLSALAEVGTEEWGLGLLGLADGDALRTYAEFGALSVLNSVASTDITNGTILNEDIHAAAAIAVSKISGLGSLATLSAVGSSQITDGAITNADVSASAAIAISKIDGLQGVLDAKANNLHAHLVSEVTGFSTNRLFGTGGTFAVGQEISVSSPLSLSAGTLSIGNIDLASKVTGTLPPSNGGTGITSLGSGVGTWLATPSSANLAGAVTDETGEGPLMFGSNPTVVGKLGIEAAGESDGGGVETIIDPLNASARALRILPPGNSSRIYVGKSGTVAFSLNLQHVAQIEYMPSFTVGDFVVGALANTSIRRGDGGTEIAANHPTGYGLDVYQHDGWDTASLAHRALNVHRTNGVTVFGSSTTRTNYEGLSIRYDGTRYSIKPVAGSGGGTVRAVRLWLTEAVWIGSGSGTPEAVETAGIGSIYTDTATGNVYRKTSGSGNTGWVTP